MQCQHPDTPPPHVVQAKSYRAGAIGVTRAIGICAEPGTRKKDWRLSDRARELVIAENRQIFVATADDKIASNKAVRMNQRHSFGLASLCQDQNTLIIVHP